MVLSFASAVISGPVLGRTLGSSSPATDTEKRLDASARVLGEIMGTPDKGIPQDLLAKAACVVVIPGVKKGAFIVGAKYGRGFSVCRKSGGGWSAPAGVKVEGGSVGFQIGGSETDVIMLVMNEGAIPKLLSRKFPIGADASWTAGPVGRTASAATDAQMHAQLLTYFFFQAEDGIRDLNVTGVQTCALPISTSRQGTIRLALTWGRSRAHGKEVRVHAKAVGSALLGMKLRAHHVPVRGRRSGRVVTRREIGRASCRERGVDLGGRRIIKKKKE